MDKIRVRGPRKKLEEETKRVLELIPRMIPGKQKGEPVGVLYSLPISFKIEGNITETPKEKRKRLKAEKKAKKKN
ncbi:MAG: hypothetical protein ACSHW7_11450 [Patiriisocius sp.]|uniref:hypothetical protein n=1 Tax=Patiriisocius sp. TaxID=2822396 RepID=UPI003EF2A2DC